MDDWDELRRLRGIATSVLDHDRPGSFLTSFLEAYLRADSSNEKLLRPVMYELVKKYDMKDKYLADASYPGP